VCVFSYDKLFGIMECLNTVTTQIALPPDHLGETPL